MYSLANSHVCEWPQMVHEQHSRMQFAALELTVQNSKKIIIFSLSVPRDLFLPDLPKFLAKISQRPENRKYWSKLLMVFVEWQFLVWREIQISKIF